MAKLDNHRAKLQIPWRAILGRLTQPDKDLAAVQQKAYEIIELSP